MFFIKIQQRHSRESAHDRKFLPPVKQTPLIVQQIGGGSGRRHRRKPSGAVVEALDFKTHAAFPDVVRVVAGEVIPCAEPLNESPRVAIVRHSTLL